MIFPHIVSIAEPSERWECRKLFDDKMISGILGCTRCKTIGAWYCEIPGLQGGNSNILKHGIACCQ